MKNNRLFGVILIALGIFLLLSRVVQLPGPMFLFLLAFGFVLTWSHLGGPSRYGTIGFLIPGLVLLAIATYASIDRYVDETVLEGGLFFLLLGAAFFLVYLLHTRRAGKDWGDMNWPMFPAAGLAGFGLFVVLVQATEMRESMANLIIPILLIAAGLLLIGRSGRGGKNLE